MATPAELYVNGIKQKLRNYWAAWLPSSRFQLGDVGVLDGKFFMKVSSLEELGIRYQVQPDRDPSPIDYVSQSGVAVFLKLAGETSKALPNVPQAKAGLGIEFSSAGAFVVQAAETYEPSIKDVLTLEDQIVTAFKQGRWGKKWAVITRIVEAPVASFVVSNSSKSKVEFAAEADLSSGLAELGKATGQFSIKSQKGDVLKILAAQNVSPFFQLAAIKTRWFGSPTFGTRRVMTPSEPGDLISPDLARERSEIGDSLYLDLVLDTEVK